MDRYSSKIPLLFGPHPWAITLGQRTWYSVPKEQVDDAWRRHEDKHKEQWRREGYLKFAIKYLYYQMRYGYAMNPYEIEARAAQ